MPDLSGALAKIERAKEHIRNLDRERAAFLGSNPYTLTPEFNGETSSTLYFLDDCRDVPIVIPLIAGDAIHNLRTALDYLACWLVRDNGNEPTFHTYFPICKSAEEYRTKSKGKTQGVAEAVKQAIDTFKPYRGGDNSLWGLHKLDIIDKHNLLVVVALFPEQIKVNIGPDFLNKIAPGFIKFGANAVEQQTIYFPANKPIFPMKKGALLYNVAGNYKTNRDIDFTFDLAFGEPDIFEGKPKIQTLNGLVDTVEKIVLSFR
jgi:hypothetical protein